MIKKLIGRGNNSKIFGSQLWNGINAILRNKPNMKIIAPRKNPLLIIISLFKKTSKETVPVKP